MPLEREVESYLKKRVKALGGEVRKVRWIGRNGAPDRLVLFPEMFISFFVELKPGGKWDAHQLREAQVLRRSGLTVYLAATIEQVDNILFSELHGRT